MNLDEIYGGYRTLIERCGVHAALGPVGEGWGIEQNPHELATFLTTLTRIYPLGIQTVLEIGTGHRAGLARFMSECMGWSVTTLDRRIPDTPAPMARQIVGLSGDETVLTQLSGSYDLVIIDADHAYESVKRDFECYAPMAGKVLMFHDIAGLRDCEGVARFWNELAASRDSFYQIIAEDDRRAGIGWLTRAQLPEFAK